MRHQQPVPTAVGASAEQEPLLPFVTDSHSIALGQLDRSFSEARPLAILIGEGKTDTSFLIHSFLEGFDDDVTVARITEPCTDAIAAMKEIIQAIGFEAKEMSLADLQNVFRMFLTSQKTHHYRTIVCIEEAQDDGPWVHDVVRRLVELETHGKFGLMVILSGRPSLNELLNEPPLNAICNRAGRRAVLAPFTEAETREFIRWQVESAGIADVSQVFEFDAVTLIHELCAGIPDNIIILCSKCRDLAGQAGKAQVTTALVTKAADILGLAPGVQLSDAETAIMEVGDMSPRRARLIARFDGEVFQEQRLSRERERILIGRDKLCDIRIPSELASRHHALVIISAKGVNLVDLGSTNGTFVDGRQIKQCLLQDGQVIGVGDCRIEYAAGDKQKIGYIDTDPTNEIGPEAADPAPTEQDRDDDIQLLEIESAKTTYSAGRRARK